MSACECFPHGPNDPCACEGCWACAGAVVGCACDIAWDCEHRDTSTIGIVRRHAELSLGGDSE